MWNDRKGSDKGVQDLTGNSVQPAKSLCSPRLDGKLERTHRNHLEDLNLDVGALLVKKACGLSGLDRKSVV